MESKKLATFYVLLLTAVSLSLNVLNIRSGLPSEELALLVFGDRGNIEKLSPEMTRLRNGVYSDYEKQDGLELMKFHKPSGAKTELALDGKKTPVDESKIHAMRSALLQNRWPDEQKTLTSLATLKKGLNPHIFHYGGFYLYSCGAALKISELLGLVVISSDASYYFIHTAEAAKLYAIPKMLGGLMGALAVPLIFLIGLRFFGLRTGLLSAAFMALVPSVSAEAHSFKPFAFFIPFTLASLYFSLKALNEEKNFKSNFFLSGFFAGLSAGAMILSGAAALSPLLACFLRKKTGKWQRPFYGVLMISAGFAPAFLATNPFFLTAFSEVMREMRHLSAVQPFSPAPGKMLHYFLFEFHKILGWPLYVWTLAGTIFFLLRPEKNRLLILAVFLPFFFYTANAHWDAPHYSMLLVPFSVLISGDLLSFLLGLGKRRFLLRFMAAFTLIFTLGNSVYYHLVLRENEKNLLEAGRWITVNIPKGSGINVSGYPYFGFKSYPPFDLLNYRINEKPESDYFIMNDIDCEVRSLGLSYRDGRASDPQLKKDYRVIKEFKRKRGFPDFFYANHLYILFEQDFKIYSKTK